MEVVQNKEFYPIKNASGISKCNVIQYNHTALLYCIEALRDWQNCLYDEHSDDILCFYCDSDITFFVNKEMLGIHIVEFLHGKLKQNTLIEITNLSVRGTLFPNGFLMLHGQPNNNNDNNNGSSSSSNTPRFVISFYITLVSDVQLPPIDAIVLNESFSTFSVYCYYNAIQTELSKERRMDVHFYLPPEEDFFYGTYDQDTNDLCTWNYTHMNTYTKSCIRVEIPIPPIPQKMELYWKDTSFTSLRRNRRLFGWDVYLFLRRVFFQYITTMETRYLDFLTIREFTIMSKIDPRMIQSLFQHETMYNSLQWEKYLTYEFYPMFLNHRSKLLMQKNDILQNINGHKNQHEIEENENKEEWKKRIFHIPHLVQSLSCRDLSVLECIRKINRTSSYYAF